MASLGTGDAVRIIDGPWGGLPGTVGHADHQHERVEVAVAVYGRQTVFRLGPSQVERR